MLWWWLCDSEAGVTQSSQQIARVFQYVSLSLRVELIQLSEMPNTITRIFRNGVDRGNVVNRYMYNRTHSSFHVDQSS